MTKNDQPRDDAGRFNTKHGGVKAIGQLSRGETLTGLAAEAELQAETDLESIGITGILRKNALRVQAVADLFYGALLTAAQSGDLNALANYAQRYAWLSGCALRNWQALGAETRGKSPVTAVDVMRSLAKTADNEGGADE